MRAETEQSWETQVNTMITRLFIDNHDIDYAGQPDLRAFHEEGFPPLARSTIIFTYIVFHTKLDYGVFGQLHDCITAPMVWKESLLLDIIVKYLLLKLLARE